MAKVIPFPGLRPKTEFASRVAALPYDVYNVEEARKIIEKDDASFLAVDLPLATMPEGTDPKSEAVYEKAKENMEKLESSYLAQDENPGFYIYELIMNGRSQTGFVCCTSVDEYLDETIKKHENTISHKEADRIKHIDALDAHTGPIFMVYKSREKIQEIIQREASKTPEVDFISDDGITHRVWTIKDEEIIEELKEEFSKVENLYIADGHHRSASAAKVAQMRRKENPNYTGNEEYNHFLAVLFPMEVTKIFDYNRVVKDLNGLNNKEFLEKLEENFQVEEAPFSPYSPEEKGNFGLFLEEKWYRLKLKDKTNQGDIVSSLDASILQDLVLKPILGIDDPRTNSRIDFVGGIRGLKELENRCKTDMKLAFSMYPTSIEELIAVADSGENMPPKSTWFEPKLRSGLFIHKLK